jgi:hypothetical protein
MFATDKGKDDTASFLVNQGADLNLQNNVCQFFFSSIIKKKT